MRQFIGVVERGLVPDAWVRRGIRRLLRRRAGHERPGVADARAEAIEDLLAAMREGPIEVHAGTAGEAQLEAPMEFFRMAIGHRLKYSCCLWHEGCDALDAAEDAMLTLICERAGIEDGQSILELGCGWGSLSLWLARYYRKSTITAVSNSDSQRQYIEAKAREGGLRNLKAVTADINDFDPPGGYDRVVVVEAPLDVREHRAGVDYLSAALGSSRD
jgi:cyclopropane-fatty-acyl-phospholipid synthase